MALIPYNSIVTTPAPSKDMTVLDTVKMELGLTATTDDVLIAILIQQASSKAVELAGREFAAETMTEYFRQRWGQHCDTLLQLSRRPIKTVTSVVEDGTTLTSADYEILSVKGRLQRLNSSGNPQHWSSGKIVVVYNGGFTMLTEESNALERIVIDEIKRLYAARQRDPQLKSESVFDVATFTYQANGFGQGNKDPMLKALEEQQFAEPSL